MLKIKNYRVRLMYNLMVLSDGNDKLVIGKEIGRKYRSKFCS